MGSCDPSLHLNIKHQLTFFKSITMADAFQDFMHGQHRMIVYFNVKLALKFKVSFSVLSSFKKSKTYCRRITQTINDYFFKIT